MELSLIDAAVVRSGARPDRETYARFWRPFTPKVADVACGEVTVRDVPLHAHESVQLLLPLSSLAVSGGALCTTVVHPGSIHVTGPLELRGVQSLGGRFFSARILLVAPAVLARISSGMPSVTELVVPDRDLYVRMMAVFDALRRPLMTESCLPRLLECLAEVLSRQPDVPSTLSRRGARAPVGVVRVRDHLRANPVQNLTLDQLADVAGLSKFYLLRSFYRAYGMTPHAYQMQLRLARARRLLAEGRPLSHVTYDAGFADQSHLTRRFAAFYGLTPARYARQLRSAPDTAQMSTTRIVRSVTPHPAA